MEVDEETAQWVASSAVAVRDFDARSRRTRSGSETAVLENEFRNRIAYSTLRALAVLHRGGGSQRRRRARLRTASQLH